MGVVVGDSVLTGKEFAQLIGVSEAKVSQLRSEGVLADGSTGQQWLHAYCYRLREVAAGRASAEEGGLDLVQERAALARSQRIGVDIKNAVAFGEYASISLLSQVLATASQSIVDQIDSLGPEMKRLCPHLTADDREVVLNVLSKARADWIRRTQKLVVEAVIGSDDDADKAAGDDAEFAAV